MNSPPYSAQEVANSFIDLAAEKELDALTPMKLQKLIFFAHGWYLGWCNQPLINDTIQAWEYGPVVESLYHDLKAYGANEVVSPILGFSFDGTSIHSKVDKVENKETLDFLRQILDVYGEYTAIQLSNLSHEENTPWDRVRSQFPDIIQKRSIPIPNELIRSYYHPLLHVNEQ